MRLSEYLPLVNTVFLMLLAMLERRTSRHAKAAGLHAEAAAHASGKVARVVKESHNALIDEMEEQRVYEEETDGTHRFPRRKRIQDRAEDEE